MKMSAILRLRLYFLHHLLYFLVFRRARKLRDAIIFLRQEYLQSTDIYKSRLDRATEHEKRLLFIAQLCECAGRVVERNTIPRRFQLYCFRICFFAFACIKKQGRIVHPAILIVRVEFQMSLLYRQRCKRPLAAFLRFFGVVANDRKIEQGYSIIRLQLD